MLDQPTEVELSHHYRNTEIDVLEITDEGNFRVSIRLDGPDHFASDSLGEIIPCVMTEEQKNELDGFLSMHNPTKDELIDELMRLGVSVEC